MGIKYGMPTLIELNSIEDNIRLCKQLGLDFVELNMNMPYCLPENNDIDQLKDLKKEYRMDFTMHFPEEIDFATCYEEMHEANIRLFRRYCQYGSKIGVKKINIHLPIGTKVTLPDRVVYVYESFKEQYLKNIKRSFDEIIKIAKNHQIQLCVENLSVPPFLAKILLELKEIDGLHFTYDVGHDAAEDFSVTSVYQELGDKVTHMHLHDCDKKRPHQVLFTGIINLYERLEFAKKNDMSVVIEVKTVEALKKSVENIIMRNIK